MRLQPSSERRPTRWAGTRSAIAGFALLGVFVTLGLMAKNGTDADIALSDELHSVWRGTAGTAAEIVSAILGPVLPILAAAGLAAAAFHYRGRDTARAALLVRVLVVLAACRLTSFLAKPLFERDRPREYPDFAYPSGHVTSVAATGFAAVLLAAWLAPRLTPAAVTASTCAVVVCSASRVVLDVHWLTDTIGAAAGVTGVGLLAAALMQLVPVPPSRPGVQSAP